MKICGEWIHRLTFSWPRHYLEVNGQLQAQTALTSGKSTNAIGKEADGPQSTSGQGELQILNPTGTQTATLGGRTRGQSLYRLDVPVLSNLKYHIIASCGCLSHQNFIFLV
jgi:hypothetical protein